MVHDVQTIRDDLAFMRALAQEGRRAPLLIGHSLLSGGLVFSAASVAAWAVATHLIPAPAWTQSLVWLAAVVLYVPYVRHRARTCAVASRPGATATNNRAVGAVWRGLGYALLALFAAFEIMWVLLKTPIVFDAFPSVVLALYGAAWTVAGAMSDRAWIGRIAWGCYAAAILLALMVQTPLQFFAMAAALLGLMALPGWLLMQDEPSDVV